MFISHNTGKHVRQFGSLVTLQLFAGLQQTLDACVPSSVQSLQHNNPHRGDNWEAGREFEVNLRQSERVRELKGKDIAHEAP